MTANAKKQTKQHLIDASGQHLLRDRLPRHWLLREYRPDYGLDFALEIFAPPKTDKKPATYETLGEHLFVQLKTVELAESKPLQIYSRHNVEKQRENLDTQDLVGELETVRFPLETSELVTVERMGVGVPVLLVVADLSKSKCFFVCLNDYIDKILIPRHEDYRTKAHRTIHIPILNEVGTSGPGQVALRWYAKRPKLYSAFQRFVFQHAELAFVWPSPEWPSPESPYPEGPSPEALAMARYFAARIMAYDFWDDTEMWGLIAHYGAAVKRFLASGSPGLMRINEKAIKEFTEGDAEREKEIIAQRKNAEVLELWRLLAVLPRNYEDVCREWFLPTGLGFMAGFRAQRLGERGHAKGKAA